MLLRIKQKITFCQKSCQTKTSTAAHKKRECCQKPSAFSAAALPTSAREQKWSTVAVFLDTLHSKCCKKIHEFTQITWKHFFLAYASRHKCFSFTKKIIALSKSELSKDPRGILTYTLHTLDHNAVCNLWTYLVHTQVHMLMMKKFYDRFFMAFRLTCSTVNT